MTPNNGVEVESVSMVDPNQLPAYPMKTGSEYRNAKEQKQVPEQSSDSCAVTCTDVSRVVRLAHGRFKNLK